MARKINQFKHRFSLFVVLFSNHVWKEKQNTGLIRLIIAHVHDLLHVITQNSGLKIAIYEDIYGDLISLQHNPCRLFAPPPAIIGSAAVTVVADSSISHN